MGKRIRDGALRQRPDDCLIVPFSNPGQKMHIFFPGLGNAVKIAEKLLVPSRRRDENVAGITPTNIGEAMHDPFGDLHTCPGPDDFGPVANQIFQRPFQNDEQLVL